LEWTNYCVIENNNLFDGKMHVLTTKLTNTDQWVEKKLGQTKVGEKKT